MQPKQKKDNHNRRNPTPASVHEKTVNGKITPDKMLPLSEDKAQNTKLSEKEQKKLDNELWKAAKNGDIEKIKTCLDLNINIQNIWGETVLMWAAYKGYTAICKLLIDHGANLNVRNESGNTALMLADNATRDNTETVKYLLSVGANPLLKNNDGNTVYDRKEKEEIRQVIKAFENLWKRWGEEQILILVRNINTVIRECSPEKMYSIIVNQ